MTALTAPIKHVQHWVGAWPWVTASPLEAARSRVRNGDALASYLFGIFSPLPLLGLLFGLPALVLGARGLRYARENPGAGGILQCRIGMALGGFFAVVYLAVGGFLAAVLLT
ncbi:MAG TPA: hypothetical protein VMR44_08270 [Thermoanaerobaculia bacterium]|nr:hypothetical protein [Thermoanaerobaculia bacterium]